MKGTITQGAAPHIIYGVFRAIAVTPERKFVTDARDMVAHFNDEGDVDLIAEYQAGFVEVALRWSDLERLYKMAKRRQEQSQEGSQP